MKHFRAIHCGNTRCIDGRVFQHRPFHDDPYFEQDIGRCEECDGAGCDRLHRENAEKIARDRIVTTYVYPPIPDRRYDWCATRSNDEPNDSGAMLQGHGRTERDAIDDLIAQIEDEEAFA